MPDLGMVGRIETCAAKMLAGVFNHREKAEPGGKDDLRWALATGKPWDEAWDF
jgi:hypothetical protein